MEAEQIIKKVDWLDEERRKDKNKIASMEERIHALDANLPSLAQQIQSLSSEITRLNALMVRLETYDSNLAQMRLENKQSIEDLEKQMRRREEENEKLRKEVEALLQAKEIAKEKVRVGDRFTHHETHTKFDPGYLRFPLLLHHPPTELHHQLHYLKFYLNRVPFKNLWMKIND